MEPSIFRYILRYSKPQQIFLAVLTLSYFPFQYLSLDLPKIIINNAVSADGAPPFVFRVFGFPISVDMEQLAFLLALCFSYLALVFITGALKYYINVYRGRLGERLLRRLRYQLYSRVLRFPLAHFRRTSQGETIPMITSEVEPLGGFIGTAYVDPLFNGGQLLIILGFIMLQNWWLGVAAIALYPLQMYLIPKLQRKVNELGKRRVRMVRRLSDHIGESISGITEIHANDTSNLELARFSDRMWQIYKIRYEIFVRKFFIKFLNNFIDKLTPFFFLSIGGWLVIEDQLTIGALTAVLAAYKDISAPWKQLLTWYQQKEDMRIKYDQVVRQFAPIGMLDEDLQHAEDGADKPLEGDLVVNNVSLQDDDGSAVLENVSFTVPVVGHTAIVGDSNSGKQEMAQILARLMLPTGGTITIGDQKTATLPEAITGRRMAYVGPSAYLYSASIGDNLLYGLKHRPHQTDGSGDSSDEMETFREEAAGTGNLPFDYNADWIDYNEAGASDRASLMPLLLETLKIVELEEDVYRMGLRGVLDPENRPAAAEAMLTARSELRERLQDPKLRPLVESFDVNEYNTNATVAENLLFGSSVHGAFDVDEIFEDFEKKKAERPLTEQEKRRLVEGEYVRQVLDQVGLTEDFLTIGKQVAETMVDIFADLPPGHEFFERFSFIRSDDLPEFQAILARAEQGLETLKEEEKLRLMSLTFKLAPARHRLGLIDEPIRERVLEARQLFRKDLPNDLKDGVAFFERETYNPAATVQDNILFGKTAHGQAMAASKIGHLISDVIESLNLRETVIELGLDYEVGVGGSRLPAGQRQKVSIARALLKRPDILIVSDGGSGLDAPTETRLMNAILDYQQSRGTIWILNQVANAEKFGHIIVMKQGRVVEQGPFGKLSESGGELPALLKAS